MIYTISLHLPYPPTGNHAVRHSRGRHFKTSEYVNYLSSVRAIIANRGMALRINEQIEVTVLICPPDRRRRDLDNVWKTLGDSITSAGLWSDDFLITKLTLERGPVIRAGAVFVSVQKFVAQNFDSFKNQNNEL